MVGHRARYVEIKDARHTVISTILIATSLLGTLTPLLGASGILLLLSSHGITGLIFLTV
jgi:hypothetical protein